VKTKVTRATALASTSGQLRDWHLSLTCLECGFIECLPLAEQISRHGAHYPLTAILETLSCRSCGRKSGLVHLVDAHVALQKVALIWPDKP
jgi:hypothetical protein